MGKEQKPLEGIRVLDLSMLLPGPLCSMYLGDWGAEIIKIENPKTGDPIREWGEHFFLICNRNKKSLTLSLKKPEGKEIFLKLVKNADILIEGFRPNTMEKLGLGYEELKKHNPKLIYCGIYGYGKKSPYRDLPGHDGNYISLSGVLHHIGIKERPILPAIQIADIAGGVYGALVGILLALYKREKTQKGEFIDISMVDFTLPFLSLLLAEFWKNQEEPQREEFILSGKLPNYHLYKTKDGKWVFLGALERNFLLSFLRKTQQEDLVSLLPQEENWGKIQENFQKFFSQKTLEDLQDLFQEDICLSPVYSLKEVLKDPHFKERDLFLEKEGKNFLGNPWKFAEIKEEFFLLPPKKGEHTQEILEELGYSPQEIDLYRKKRII